MEPDSSVILQYSGNKLYNLMLLIIERSSGLLKMQHHGDEVISNPDA